MMGRRGDGQTQVMMIIHKAEKVEGYQNAYSRNVYASNVATGMSTLVRIVSIRPVCFWDKVILVF